VRARLSPAARSGAAPGAFVRAYPGVPMMYGFKSAYMPWTGVGTWSEVGHKVCK